MPQHTKPAGYKSVNASQTKMPKINKPRKQLTKLQSDFMKEHSKKHSPAHNKEMRKLLKEGYCLEIAHKLAMKNVGA
jgi:hypothetical protein